MGCPRHRGLTVTFSREGRPGHVECVNRQRCRLPPRPARRPRGYTGSIGPRRSLALMAGLVRTHIEHRMAKLLSIRRDQLRTTGRAPASADSACRSGFGWGSQQTPRRPSTEYPGLSRASGLQRSSRRSTPGDHEPNDQCRDAEHHADHPKCDSGRCVTRRRAQDSG